jgi:hypothetical protein
MKAGRELDALIHEKIFGKCAHVLHAFKKDNKNSWMSDYTYYRCKKCKDGTYSGLLYSEGKILCPQYSTNIADAWLVVEKMQEKGWLVSIRNFPKWTCEICFYDPIIVYAETAPLAICLAALKACGVEVEG